MVYIATSFFFGGGLECSSADRDASEQDGWLYVFYWFKSHCCLVEDPDV